MIRYEVRDGGRKGDKEGKERVGRGQATKGSKGKQRVGQLRAVRESRE